jgi:hypothetical protein
MPANAAVSAPHFGSPPALVEQLEHLLLRGPQLGTHFGNRLVPPVELNLVALGLHLKVVELPLLPPCRLAHYFHLVCVQYEYSMSTV